MSALPRGICRVCHRSVALRKGNLTREHTTGLHTNLCPGSGQPPQSDAEANAERGRQGGLAPGQSVRGGGD
jgi:hypothetical protein